MSTKKTTKKAVKKAAKKAAKKATKKAAKKATARKVTFSFYSPLSGSVELAGEFNKWNPAKTALTKNDDGVWSTVVDLKPGAYQYKFVFDGSWECDPQAQQVEAEHGMNNIIEVK